jgi:4-amino-4-deoxy-L-arabinose transferase-like glycosyltransferase
LLLALLWLPAAFLRPPVRQQELRVLITARNMVERQDWLHPVFQNQPRYRKPPMAYWLAASGFTLSGQHRSAWAGRLPSLLVALIGIAAFIKSAGPHGPSAGLLLGASFGLWFYGPLAETDMPQLTGLLLSFYGWRRKSGGLTGACMAFAALSKGPGGILVPLITMALLGKRHPRSLRFWLTSLLIPLCASGAWILFLLLDPIAKTSLARELSATFIDTAHRNPLPYYLYTLPLLMVPALFLVLGKKRTNTEAQTPRDIPWTWLIVTFILLTITVSKQRHYALMLMPPAAWLLASYFPKVKTLRFKPLLATTLLIGLTEIPVALFSSDGKHAAFLRSLHPQIPAQATLHVVGVNSAIFDFHLGRHVANIDSAQAALSRAQAGEPIIVIQKSKHFDAETHESTQKKTADSGEWIRRYYLKE